MALFGNAATKRKPWDTGMDMPTGTPPIYSPPGAMPPDLNKTMNTLPPPAPKPGFLDRGGFGADFLGNTVDALLQMRGAGAVYDPPEQRRSKLLAQQQAENRQYEQAEWQRREQYKRDNPLPVNNDTSTDWAFYKQNLSPEEFEKWKVNNVVDKPHFSMLPSGQVGMVGGYQPPKSAAAPPPEAVADLQRDPSAAAEFDEVFGPGAAARILGGAGPQTPRNFP